MSAATPKIALRTMLAVTVACGLALSACSSDAPKNRIDPKSLQAPALNPQIQDGRVVQPGARSPEGNVGLGTGSNYQNKSYSQAPATLPTRQPEPEAPGWFDWAWKEPMNAAKDVVTPDEQTPAARSVPANNGVPVSSNDTQRKRPALNAQGAEGNDVFLAPSTYAAVEAGHVDVQEVPVSDAQVFAADNHVAHSDMAAPQEQFASENHSFAHEGTVAAPVEVAQAPAPIVHAPVEHAPVVQQEAYVPVEPTEVAPIAAKNDYPVLSSVPPRPERLAAVEERDEKFVELEREYEASTAARQEQAAQVAHDTTVDTAVDSGQPTSMAQDGYSGIQSYGEEITIVEEQVETPVASAAPVEAPAQEAQVATLSEPAAGEPYAWQSNAAKRATGGEQHADTTAVAPVQTETASVQQFEEIPVVQEQSEAVVIEEYVHETAPAQVAAPAPVAAPVAEPAPVVAAAPAPVAAPQAEVAAVEAGEWVSVDQTPAQTVVPVESAEVAVVPQTDSVALAPEAAGVTLTAPNVYGEKTVRVLPDSRYAARRQAVYSQQYARRQAVDSAN
ncbi:MAG: hypothetical protein FJX23_03640 [Alphaproteobacteria bacterium]|nr:hypothetical protein [Alphaproteobacteria bacterium]